MPNLLGSFKLLIIKSINSVSQNKFVGYIEFMASLSRQFVVIAVKDGNQ